MKLSVREYLLLLCTVSLCCILFYPTLNAEFTNWDDPLHITENKKIQTLSVESIGNIFIPHTEYMYHPLTMVTYAIEWYIGNGSAKIFHITNVLLHLGNIILVFFFISKVSRNTNIGLLVALIFGIHPINVEAVSWISARKDLLYSFFLLLGANFYIQYLEKNDYKKLALVLLTFICGLLSKPTMVVFPLLILTLDRWYYGRFDSKKIIEKIPFFLVSIGYGIFTLLLSESDVDAVSSISFFPIDQRILLVCYAAVFYIGKILFPINLSAVYSFPEMSPEGLTFWYTISPIIVILFFALVLYFGRRHKFLLFGIALYLLPLLLVIQIFPFNNASLVADRYAYIASIGILFIAANLIKLVTNKFVDHKTYWRMTSYVFLSLIVGVLLISSVKRVSVWKDSESIFSDVIEKKPNIWLAYGNRSIARMINDDHQGALEDINAAIALLPQKRSLYGIRGNVHNFLKDYPRAISDFDTVTFSKNAQHQDFFNKATAFYHLQQYDSSLVYHAKALIKDSTFSQAYLNIGFILLKERNEIEKSKQNFDLAIKHNPISWEPLYYRAEAHFKLKQYAFVLQDLSEAVLRNPKIGSDTLVIRINDMLKTINTRVRMIQEQIDAKESQKQLYEELAVYYIQLSDSTRFRNISDEISLKFVKSNK